MTNRTSKRSADHSQRIVDLVDDAIGSQAAGFQALSGRKAKKGARQDALKKRLTAELDPQDPRLAAVKLSQQRNREAAVAYEQRARRLNQRQSVKKEEWVIAGTVRLASGRPAIKYTVEVSDKEGKFRDQLGSTVTNEYGDFSIHYVENQFDEAFRKKRPALFIQLRDPQGNVVASSEPSLKINFGRAEYFKIFVEKKQR